MRRVIRNSGHWSSDSALAVSNDQPTRPGPYLQIHHAISGKSEQFAHQIAFSRLAD